MSQFTSGGFVQGDGDMQVVLEPDECLLRPPHDRRAVCIRGDHPTATSGCTAANWIRHVSEVGE